MAFDTAPRNTEICFISSHDPAIDWEKAEQEHQITKQGYRDDPTEEKSSQLEPLPGQSLTVFYLALPDSAAINKAMEQAEGTPQAFEMALRCIKAADGLKQAGRDVTLKRRADGRLDDASQSAIPWAVMVEIGFYLLARGSGLSDPLPS